MNKKSVLRLLGLVAAGAMTISLSGCGGSGDTGPAGPQGPTGPAGPPGSNQVAIGSNAETNATVLAAKAALWRELEPTIAVTGVTIASSPVVTFTVTDAFGRAVAGLGNTSQSSTATLPGLANLSFSLAKLVPGTNGSPSKWVSYIVTTVPTKNATTGAITAATPTRPSTDNTGTLVDNGDGTYKYTFYRDVTTIAATVAGLTDPAGSNKADLGDLSWQPALTHRLTIQLGGNAPGTGTNTPNGSTSTALATPMKKPFDAIYDFIPATGQKVTAADFSRDIASNAKCEACHQRLGGIAGGSAEADAAGFHGGGRNNVQYCVVCHTDQRKYGRSEATKNGFAFTSTNTYVVDGRTIGNLPNLIHKVHLGGLLGNDGYNYADVKFNETTYPQDNRNCTSCHDGTGYGTPSAAKNATAQGDHWKSNPSRLACGACHDGIDFATGGGRTIADAASCKANPTINNAANPACASKASGVHFPGPQADDSQCTVCHKVDRAIPVADIDLNHVPVTPPSPTNALIVRSNQGGNTNTNAAWIASGASVNRLPIGAIKVTYEINAVKRVNISGGYGNPQIVFRMKQDGVVTPLLDFATAPVNPVTTQKEIWANFAGAPSLYFVYSVPQDGIAKPADFNVSSSVYLRTLWKCVGAGGCTTGSLTGPDANGWYTGTILNARIPDSAVMLTGGLGYSYNVTSALPLTQTNLTIDFPAAVSAIPTGTNPGDLTAGMPNITGGLIVIAPNVQKVASDGCVGGSTNCANAGTSSAPSYVGYNARRPIVEDARCNACHQELGTFTEDAFHAGQRNDGSTCSWCHRPNQTSSGWSADSTSFVHAIHAAAKRGDTNKYTWHAASTSEGFWDVTYPGLLNNCEGCHLPNTYDFSATASAAAVDNRLYRTVATGKFTNVVGGTYTTYSGAGCATLGTSTAQTATGAFALSPWITADANGTAGTNYGVGFSYNAGTGASNSCAPDGTAISIASGQIRDADPNTLVTSPTTTVCLACHTTPEAISHFKINAGSVYAPRSTALGTTETCLVCHGNGRIADISVMHAKNR